MVAQVANVKSVLGSVHQMLKAGQRVHFEPGNCYIQDMHSGKVTRIEERDGTYEVGLWVPKSKSSSHLAKSAQQCEDVQISAQQVEDAPPESTFARQDKS